MQNKRILFSIILISTISFYFFFYKSCSNYILYHNDIRIIEEYLSFNNEENSKTAVIFDIDNTLAEPITVLGSEQWFYALVSHLEKYGYSHLQAIDFILPLYVAIMNESPLQLAQPESNVFINNLSKKNVLLLSLTARSAILADRTIEQLQDLGIDFYTMNNMSLPSTFPIERDIFFKQGIIFVGNENKGTSLMAFFKKIGYYPDKIIFIDDKIIHIRSVKKAVSEKNIKFIGICYNRLEKKIKSFKFEETWHMLKKFYEDYNPSPQSLLQYAP